MQITLTIKELELDFDMDDASDTPSAEEQQAITQAQIAEPVVFEPKVEDYREYFHLDTIQDWATDVISDRSGWCVSSVQWQ